MGAAFKARGTQVRFEGVDLAIDPGGRTLRLGGTGRLDLRQWRAALSLEARRLDLDAFLASTEGQNLIARGLPSWGGDLPAMLDLDLAVGSAMLGGDEWSNLALTGTLERAGGLLLRRLTATGPAESTVSVSGQVDTAPFRLTGPVALSTPDSDALGRYLRRLGLENPLTALLDGRRVEGGRRCVRRSREPVPAQPAPRPRRGPDHRKRPLHRRGGRGTGPFRGANPRERHRHRRPAAPRHRPGQPARPRPRPDPGGAGRALRERWHRHRHHRGEHPDGRRRPRGRQPRRDRPRGRARHALRPDRRGRDRARLGPPEGPRWRRRCWGCSNGSGSARSACCRPSCGTRPSTSPSASTGRAAPPRPCAPRPGAAPAAAAST